MASRRITPDFYKIVSDLNKRYKRFVKINIFLLVLLFLLLGLRFGLPAFKVYESKTPLAAEYKDCDAGKVLKWQDDGLSCDVDTDNQLLEFDANSYTLKIENGNSVDLSALRIRYDFKDGLKQFGNIVSIDAPICKNGQALSWNGQSFVCVSDSDTTYSAAGTLLQLTGTTFSIKEGTLTGGRLCTYDATNGLVCNTDITSVGTDNQTLTWDGTTDQLSISGGNSVSLSDLAQTLSLVGDTLTISHTGSSVTFTNWDTDVTDDVQNLTDLQEVTVSSPTNNQVLKYNGTNWINSVLNFTDLGDTPTNYGTNGYLLQTDGSGSIQYVNPLTTGLLDADWFRAATSTPATNINDNIYTLGRVAIGSSNPITTLDVVGRMAVGDSITSTQAVRAFNLLSSDAVLRIMRYNDNFNHPSVELIHFNTSISSIDAYWDFYTETRSGRNAFVIRSRWPIDAVQALTADQNGGVAIGPTYFSNIPPAEGLIVPGYVGIGTPTPASILDIRENTSSDTMVRIWNTGAGGAKLRFVADTGQVSQHQWTDSSEWLASIAVDNTQGMRFNVRSVTDPNTESALDSATRMIISRNGNVGIGTTSPVEKLEVAGGIKIDNTSNTNAGTIRWTGSRFEGYDGTNWVSLVSLWTDAGSYIYPNNNNQFIVEDSGKVKLGVSATPFTSLAVKSASVNAPAISWYASDGSTYLGSVGSYSGDNAALTLADNTGTTQVLLHSAGNSYFMGGRVGIGTTTPSHQLQVVGNVRATRFLGANGTAGSPAFRFNSDADTGMFRYAADTLAMSTAGVERLLIDPNGFVGIGTTAPGAKLHVESGEIWLFNDGANPRFVIGDNTTDYGWLQWDSANNYFRIDVATSPGTGLKVAENTLVIGDVWPDPAALFIAADGTTERFRITSDGKVGIGTNTPLYALDINGDARLTGALYDSTNNPGTAGQVLVSTGSGVVWENRKSCLIGGARINGSAGSIISSFGNIASVTKVATGRYDINFTNTVAVSDYYVQVSKEESQSIRDDVNIDVASMSNTGFRVIIHEGDNGSSANNFRDRNFSVTIYDSQCTYLSDLAFSDKRLKKDIEPLVDFSVLDKIKQLQAVKFRWNKEKYPSRLIGKPDQEEYGFIAQEVKEVLPQVVTKGGDGYYRLHYDKLVPFLVEAVKELDNKITALNADAFSEEQGWVLDNDILRSMYSVNVGKLSVSDLTATNIKASSLTASTLSIANDAFIIDAEGSVAIKEDATLFGALTVKKEVKTSGITIFEDSKAHGRVHVDSGHRQISVNVEGLTSDDMVFVTVLGAEPVSYSLEIKNGEFVVYFSRVLEKEIEFIYYVVKVGK